MSQHILQHWLPVTLFLTLLWSSLALSTPLYAAERLTLGVHPYLSAKQLREKFTPLVVYLSRELDKPVLLNIAKDYAEHIRLIGEDKLDIAYLGPAPYVEMREQYGAKPMLARLEIQGKPTFRGAWIVSLNSDIQTLQDIQGKRVAFGSKHSTMSHLLPRAMLLEAGITHDDVSDLAFLDNHENVALGVLMGEFDAGAVKEETYYKYQNKGLKLLTWTPWISEHVFVAGKHIATSEIEAMRNALLALKDSPKTPTILHPIKQSLTGLVPVQDSDYANLRNYLNRLHALGIPKYQQ
jgi:phosphonate transport system substrate-binding protein